MYNKTSPIFFATSIAVLILFSFVNAFAQDAAADSKQQQITNQIALNSPDFAGTQAETVNDLASIFRPASNGIITGRVTSAATGLPFNASIFLYTSDQTTIPFDSTGPDNEGFYQFSAPPGDYYVLFNTASGTFADEWFENAIDVTEATIVSVSSGITTAEINAEIDSRPLISGVAQSAVNNQPIENVRIRAEKKRDDGSWDSLAPFAPIYFTNADGGFALYLDPGTYRLEVTPPDLDKYGFEFFDGSRDGIGAFEFVLPAFGTAITDVVITVDENPKVQGTLINNLTSQPVSGAHIRLVPADLVGQAYEVTADVNGQYSVQLPPNNYRIYTGHKTDDIYFQESQIFSSYAIELYGVEIEVDFQVNVKIDAFLPVVNRQ